MTRAIHCDSGSDSAVLRQELSKLLFQPGPCCLWGPFIQLHWSTCLHQL